MMNDLRFANPDASIGIAVVAIAIALLAVLEWRRSSALQHFLSITMQPRLVSRLSAGRRWFSLALVAAGACWLVVALMRPQFGLRFIESPRVGAQIMVCLDVSRSMLAEDVAPNRLERAKADVTDLLGFLEGDQVGLIGFAGRATVLCPLTTDYSFFKLVLDDTGPSSVGLGGTKLEEPIRKAVEGFRQTTDVSRIIVLITDGEDQDSHPMDAAKLAVERGIRLITVGFGDEAGSEIRITDPRTGVQTTVVDENGTPVVSRLDGEQLRDLAMATEGVYIPAGTGTLDLRSIYDAHLKPLVRDSLQSEGRAVRQEAFQWPVLAGMLCWLASIVVARTSESDTEEDSDET